MLPRSDGLFQEIAERVVGEAGDLQFERFYRDGKTLTPDQGRAATTKEMAQAVLEAYRNA